MHDKRQLLNQLPPSTRLRLSALGAWRAGCPHLPFLLSCIAADLVFFLLSQRLGWGIAPLSLGELAFFCVCLTMGQFSLSTIDTLGLCATPRPLSLAIAICIVALGFLAGMAAWDGPKSADRAQAASVEMTRSAKSILLLTGGQKRPEERKLLEALVEKIEARDSENAKQQRAAKINFLLMANLFCNTLSPYLAMLVEALWSIGARKATAGFASILSKIPSAASRAPAASIKAAKACSKLARQGLDSIGDAIASHAIGDQEDWSRIEAAAIVPKSAKASRKPSARRI